MYNWKDTRNYRRFRDENGNVIANIIYVDGKEVAVSDEVYEAYCKRLKYILDRSVSTMEIDSLTNAQVAEALSASFSCETSDFLFDAEKVLTEKERKIIALVYECQLSSAEIARKLRTTRQNVNQCKKRAELKLRAYYEK